MVLDTIKWEFESLLGHHIENSMFTLVITVISGGFFSDPRTVTYIPNFKTEALCIQAGEKVKEQNKGAFSGTL